MDLTPLPAELSAYCAHCRICDTTGVTADGSRVEDVLYSVAADSSLPFGAVVMIPAGYGVLDNVRAFDRSFIVRDRGQAVEREARERRILRLDILVASHEYAKVFGRRRLTVWLQK